MKIPSALLESDLCAIGRQLLRTVQILQSHNGCRRSSIGRQPADVATVLIRGTVRYVKVFEAKNGEGAYDTRKHGEDMRTAYENRHPDDVGVDAKAFQDARSEVKEMLRAGKQPTTNT